MRIGIDARPLSYRLTGIGMYLKHLLDALQPASGGHDVYLISNTHIDYDPANPRWHKVEGRVSRKLTSTAWMQGCAPIIAMHLGLDLFWSPRHHLPLGLPPGIRTVVTIHDVVHRRYPQTMGLANLLVERLLMRVSLMRAQAVITDARSTQHDLQRWYHLPQDKLHCIHPGVPLFAKSSSAGSSLPNLPLKYLLFVGTLDPRKNFDRLFEAFGHLDPARRNLHLVLVGARGWKNRAFLQRLEDSSLRPFVRVTGYLTRAQLAELYRHALCLVFPSLYEGFGFPILEAMALGTPVITSTVSCMPEVAGDAALLVDPRSPQAITAAMQRVITDGALRARLIAAGRRRVVQFSWQRCVQDTLRVMEKVMQP